MKDQDLLIHEIKEARKYLNKFKIKKIRNIAENVYLYKYADIERDILFNAILVDFGEERYIVFALNSSCFHSSNELAFLCIENVKNFHEFDKFVTFLEIKEDIL